MLNQKIIKLVHSVLHVKQFMTFESNSRTFHKMSELSAAELARITAEKQKRRLALRLEYIKEISNPYNHASGQGGTLFDAGLQRFQAVRVTHFEHFKPNTKTARFAGLMVIGPILLYGLIMNKERTDREKRVRSGEVSYRDRRFRFI